MSGQDLKAQVHELLGYVRDYFEDSDAPSQDPDEIAEVILEGALLQAARELRLHGLLEMGLVGLGSSPMSELCKPRKFNFIGMAGALESAAGIALVAQALHDRLTKKPETESEAAQ